ncbi:MAG: 3'-5' exonuclease, partial [Burkholderiales bacterium]
AKALLLQWLKDIGYEQHLHDGEDSEKLAAARWANVLDFIDWIARRCGGEVTEDGGRFESEAKSLLAVAQTISVIVSLAERGDERDVLTLSTLHAAKGLEWAHVVLAGVNEGLLPFVGRDVGKGAGKGAEKGVEKVDTRAPGASDALTPEQLQEERRLMYVGITRARSTLAVSTLRRRKRGRETVAGVPSRFIKEMKLDEVMQKVDPRERLKALRAASALRVEQAAREAENSAGNG